MKNSLEDSSSMKLCAHTTGILVILLENLCRSTNYYFCLTAANTAGKSASSEVIQCTTQGQGENVVPGTIFSQGFVFLVLFLSMIICFEQVLNLTNSNSIQYFLQTGK